MSEAIDLYEATLKHLLAPIGDFLADDSVSEIMVNGFDEIYVERGGRIEKTDVQFEDDDAWQAALRNITQFVGKRLTSDDLSIEARLPDGSRVHIVQAPAARKGSCVAIRKFSKHKLDVPALISGGSLTDMSAEFLSLSVAMAKNVIVSGGTGSGKTTLLNALSSMILEGERIVVLEDSSELQLQQDHVVPFEVKPPDAYGRGGIDIRSLFKASLRMRPDRIVVGECRGGEAIDMIQAMNSGHGGSMSTAHANSPLDALNRLEIMSLMGDIDLPLHALRAQIASAIELIVQITRFHDGSRRITHISEVLPLTDDGKYAVRDIFLLKQTVPGDPATRELVWTGEVPGYCEAPYYSGLSDMIVHTKPLWREPGT